MKTIFTPAMAELRAALNEAEAISAKAELTKRDEARVNVLLAKVAALRQNAVGPSNTSAKFFRALFTGNDPGPYVETRDDIFAGHQTPSWTAGAEGGYQVPQEFYNELFLGLSQNDPFFDENVVTLIKSDTYRLRPLTIPGWNLSNYMATQLNLGGGGTGEAYLTAPDVPPSAAKIQLNGWTYGAALDDSFEFEGDAFEPTIKFMNTAFVESFAKGVGGDLVYGDGTDQLQGLQTGAANSGVVTLNADKFVNDDFDNIYFKLNKRYRNSPKCAWIMSDAQYQLARKAVDLAGRPLINVVNDEERILNKRVLVSPNWGDGPGSIIGFGDLSRFVVRSSQMIIQRLTEAPGYVENGKVLYAARMRVDARIIDPTAGDNPPIIYGTMLA